MGVEASSRSNLRAACRKPIKGLQTMHPSQYRQHQAGAHLTGLEWTDAFYLAPGIAPLKLGYDLVTGRWSGPSPEEQAQQAQQGQNKPFSVPFWAYAVGGLAIGGVLVYFVAKADKK